MNMNNDAIASTQLYVSETYIYLSNHSITTVTAQSPLTPQFNIWQSTLVGIFLSTIILVSIGGNLLVCIAILTDRFVKFPAPHALNKKDLASIYCLCYLAGKV